MSFVCLNSIPKGYIQDLSSFQCGQNSSQFVFLKAFLHVGVVGPLCLLACGEMHGDAIAIAPFDILKMRSSLWPRTEKHRNVSSLLCLYWIPQWDLTIKKKHSHAQRQFFKKFHVSLIQKNGYLKGSLCPL